MRRGFKAEAEEIAAEIRVELKLRRHDPLDVFVLADHLAIPTLPLSELKSEIDEAAYKLLTVTDSSAFSGVTIVDGTKRLVVYNDAHAPVRQNSDIAHELSHALLGHPASTLTNDYGCRNFDKEIEDEANWLAGTLLVPRDAAMRIAFQNIEQATAANTYRVSLDMLSYRLRITGALIAAHRLREKAKGRSELCSK